MTIEARVREAVEGYLARVREALDSHAQELTSNLVRLVSAEQDGWTAERERIAADAFAEGARLAGQGQGAADAVRRGIVRDDNRADRIVTVVLVRQRRPDGERDEREQRGGAKRPCPGAEPLQH